VQLKTDKKIPRSLLCFLSQRSAIAALLALTSLPLRFAWADHGLEAQVKFDYLEKVLTLRHFYSGERLRFRSDGTLQGDAPIGPWTLDGQIEVEDVHLHGARLLIKGRRIHLTFDAQHEPQDQLTAIRNDRGKPQKDLEKALQHLKVEIEIGLPSEKPDEKDLSSAIRAVFLAHSESMADIVPGYWHAYFTKQEGKAAPPVKGPVYYSIKPGSGISPPHAIYSPDPDYSRDARELKYQGTIVMSLIVDPSGTTRDLQIQRPLGLGLDEKAVAAISTWKFEPAQKDGKPVPVQIHVEVNFHLY
jgi:TonB family protein